MRSQEEMLAIILKKAKQEEHIRAALLQGSRVSKEAKPDCFQDYDVVFLVDAVEPFSAIPAGSTALADGSSCRSQSLLPGPE